MRMAHKTKAGRRIIGDAGQVMRYTLKIEDDLYKKRLGGQAFLNGG